MLNNNGKAGKESAEEDEKLDTDVCNGVMFDTEDNKGSKGYVHEDEGDGENGHFTFFNCENPEKLHKKKYKILVKQHKKNHVHIVCKKVLWYKFVLIVAHVCMQ